MASPWVCTSYLPFTIRLIGNCLNLSDGVRFLCSVSGETVSAEESIAASMMDALPHSSWAHLSAVSQALYPRASTESLVLGPQFLSHPDGHKMQLIVTLRYLGRHHLGALATRRNSRHLGATRAHYRAAQWVELEH